MSRRKKLPKELVRATTHALSNDGRAIATVNGKVTFIEGALPDEIIDFQYTATKRHYDEARTVSILESSVHRVRPECMHFDICGGCSLQHLASDQQLKSKQAQFLETLKRIGGVAPEKILAPIQQSVFAYRTKARLSVRYLEKKAALLVGFRERRSACIVEMDSCVILDERVGQRIVLLREFIDQLDIKRDIPQIEIAVSEDVACLIFRVMQQPTIQDIIKFKKFAIDYHFRILLQPGGLASLCDLDFQPANNERLCYRIDDDQLEMRFHPHDFTQVNVSVNRAMIEQAMLLLDPQPDETVLDLFCGLGNFSLPLARRAKKVVGVEGESSMTQRAEENALLNKITNTKFYAANLFETHSFKQNWAKQQYQKILIDPPRSGALEAMTYVGKMKPAAILYVSCDPATLARDVNILVNEHGYHAKAAGIMDMFPHTAHIESMMLLTKKKVEPRSLP